MPPPSSVTRIRHPGSATCSTTLAILDHMSPGPVTTKRSATMISSPLTKHFEVVRHGDAAGPILDGRISTGGLFQPGAGCLSNQTEIAVRSLVTGLASRTRSSRVAQRLPANDPSAAGHGLSDRYGDRPCSQVQGDAEPRCFPPASGGTTPEIEPGAFRRSSSVSKAARRRGLLPHRPLGADQNAGAMGSLYCRAGSHPATWRFLPMIIPYSGL